MSDEPNPYQSPEAVSDIRAPPRDWFGQAAAVCAIATTVFLLFGVTPRSGLLGIVPPFLTVTGLLTGMVAQKRPFVYVIANILPWVPGMVVGP